MEYINYSAFGPFKSVLTETHVDDSREAKLQRRASHQHHLEIDNHNIHLAKWTEPREFDLDKSIKHESNQQSMYNRRLRDCHAVREANQGASGVNPWNIIEDESLIDPAILEILNSNVDDIADNEKTYQVDAYDLAVDKLADDADIYISASYQVGRAKAWNMPAQYDQSGKRINSKFDIEAYNRHVETTRKARASHEIEEQVLDQAKRYIKSPQKRLRAVMLANYAGCPTGRINATDLMLAKRKANRAAKQAKRLARNYPLKP